MTPDSIIFYHYTREERLGEMRQQGGLWARLPVLATELTSEFEGYNLVEGLLTPYPRWFQEPFGDVPLEMFRDKVGDLLLRVEVPRNFPGLYVFDNAHNFEAYHVNRRGTPVLDIGYDCRTGHEVMRAQMHSYVSALEYRGGHVAPSIQAVRKGQGVAVPQEYVTVDELQPLRDTGS